MLNFWHSQTGAVAADWTVLTAMAVAFGVIVVTELSGGTIDIAGQINATLAAASVAEAETVFASARADPPN